MTHKFGKLFGGIAVVLLVAMVASVSFAQLPTGTILGTVKDSSGGVVPGVTVTIVNTETNQTRTVVTGDDGAYRVPALRVGHYTVKTEKGGFNTETQTGLTLEVAQELVVNATMQVGSSTQAVTVTGEAPVVDTTNSALGAVVNEERVADLPLNGRNWNNLTLLQSGVVQHAETGGGSPTTTAGLYFSSNGASTRSNNFMLDGAPMVVFYGAVAASVTGSTLGVDGIREYKVETTNFSADYGLSAGSQTTIVSKGGTNSFHGDAFDFLRNSSMDAANFFDSPLDTPPGKRLPPFKRNNYGGAFGGPIRKDKTFFYAVFEGINEAQGLTPAGTTSLNNSVQTVTNSVGTKITGTCIQATSNPCAVTATNPTGTVSPIIFPLLQYLPVANGTSTSFSFPFSSPVYEQYGQIRFDQNFTDKDSAFAAYTIDHATIINVPKGGPNASSSDHLRGTSQFTRFSEVHIFSPVFLNTARFSVSRTEPGDNQVNPQYPCSAATPTPCPTSFVAGFPTVDMGGISATGIIGLPASVQVRSNQTIFAWSDDVYYTRGRNAFKFGFLLTRWKQYQDYFNGNRGSVSFTSLTNMLNAGPFNSISYSTPVTGATRDYLSGTFGAYAQDDFRVTPRVTLNLGLRYEIMVPSVYEANGNAAGLVNQATDQLTTVGPPVRNPSLLNFSPRFGFAWDIFGDGKTALRGGSSLLYDVNNLGSQLAEDGHGMPFGNTTNPQQGTTTSITGTGTAACPAPKLTIPFTFPACALGNTLIGSAYALKQPRIWTFNLNFQRQLPFGMALQVGYVGTRGQNIWNRGENNPCTPTAIINGVANWANPTGTICPNTTAADPTGRLNPYWGSMEFTNTNSRSYFNSLQVSLTKKITQGLEFQLNYTWSRNIDLGSSTLGSDSNVTDETEGAVDPINQLGNRGPAAFDVPHNIHGNLIYNLPKTSAKGFVGGLANGWWMSSIIAFQSGVPFSPIMSSNRSDSGVLVNEGDRPNVTPGASPQSYTSGTSAGCGTGASAIAPGTPVGTTNLYFNPCMFTIQPTGFLGTESRNFLRGPRLFSGDLSIVKDTAVKYLGEAGQIEFRAEIFNILNHPIFGLPNASLFSGAPQASGVVAPVQPSTGAGVISLTLPSSTSRQVQLALKLIF